MNKQMELKIQRELELKEFELRSISEAEEKSKEIAEEIKAILRKHGASLAEWNNNLYIVPPGFRVYSVWNFPIGVRLYPFDVGLTCERYDCDYRIIKPLPEKLADMFNETDK